MQERVPSPTLSRTARHWKSFGKSQRQPDICIHPVSDLTFECSLYSRAYTAPPSHFLLKVDRKLHNENRSGMSDSSPGTQYTREINMVCDVYWAFHSQIQKLPQFFVVSRCTVCSGCLHPAFLGQCMTVLPVPVQKQRVILVTTSFVIPN